MNETFLKLLPLVKLVAKFRQSLSISAFCLYEKTQFKHFEVEFFSKMILARSLRSSFNSLIYSALPRNAAKPRKVLGPFSFGHLIDHCSFSLSLIFFLVLFFTSHKFQRKRNGTAAFCRKNTIPVSL